MLAPHELKNVEFSKSLRGYSTVEVDEHIDFMVEKYTELYRANDELEKKLRLTEAQLDAMKGEEESIRSALVNAQKASTRIINEANERADVIMRSAKSSCDRLIAELKANVRKETERLAEVQREVAAFKAALFEGYQSHIELIEKIAPDIRIETTGEISNEELSAMVVERIRQNLSGKPGVISGSEDPFVEEEEEESLAEEPSVSSSAEIPIPRTLSDEDKPKEPAEVRDASLSAEAEEDEIRVARAPLSDGGSVVDSIRKLNSSLEHGEDDDEEFLRMLRNVSQTAPEHGDDEFERVYDGKKRK